jgi:formylglycine-generating enzyme required for sulfatase activity
MFSFRFILIIFLFNTVSVFFITCNDNPTKPTIEFIEPEMILIENDLVFTYGPSWDTTFVPPDSLPMLIIELDPYAIAKFEVTNEEYGKFVKDGGYNQQTYWSDAGWMARTNENWLLPGFWGSNKYWLDDPYSNKKSTPVHGISYY